jgi:hypothetical protein
LRSDATPALLRALATPLIHMINAVSPLWVNRVALTFGQLLPVYPAERTYSG